MHFRSLASVLLALFLASLLAYADMAPRMPDSVPAVLVPPQETPPPPPPPAPQISPAEIQQQQAPELQQEQQVQTQAADQALKDQKITPMDQCRRLLQQQWKVGGLVHLLTATVVKGDKVYVGGRAGFPLDNGQTEIHHYKCYFNSDRTAVVSASVGVHVLK